MNGCAAFAQMVGPTRIEAELLPQWWEQVRGIVCLRYNGPAFQMLPLNHSYKCTIVGALLPLSNGQ